MHVKFYHRVCFQSTWREGLEGGEHYYSPPGASPPLRGHRRKAGSQMGWTRPSPSSPGRERWPVTPGVGHNWTCVLPLPARRQKPWLSPTPCWLTSLSGRPEPLPGQPLSQPLLRWPCSIALIAPPRNSPSWGRNVLPQCPVLPLQHEGSTASSTGEPACLPNPRLWESSLQPHYSCGSANKHLRLLDTLQLSSEDPYCLEQHVRTQKSEVIDVDFA